MYRLRSCEEPDRRLGRRTIDPERTDAASEYTILVTVRNERNEEIGRQVINVGALQGMERRTFSLSVEMSEPKPSMPPRRR